MRGWEDEGLGGRGVGRTRGWEDEGLGHWKDEGLGG